MILRLAAALAVLLCLLAAPIHARSYSVDDLLRHENIGGVRLDPTGQWLAFEKRDAFLAMARQDRLTRSDLLRARPYLVDLRRGGPARPLVADSDRPGTVLLGFSPGGTRLAIARLEEDRLRLGIMTMALGIIDWRAITPAYDPFHTTSAWLDEDRLLLIAGPSDQQQSWPMADRASDILTRARWEATASGRLAVTTTGSGRYLRASAASPKQLLLLDLAAGRVRSLAEGAFGALFPAPDGRHVALVGDGDPRQPAADTIVREEDRPSADALWLVDLTSGAQWQACRNCGLIGEPRWDARGRQIAFATGDAAGPAIMEGDIRHRRLRRIAQVRRAVAGGRCRLGTEALPYAAAHSIEGTDPTPLIAPFRCAPAPHNGGKRQWVSPAFGEGANRGCAPAGAVIAGMDVLALGPRSKASLMRIHGLTGEQWLSLARDRECRPLMTLNRHMADVRPAVMRALHHGLPDGGQATDWLILPPGRSSASGLPLIVIPYPGLIYGESPPRDQSVLGERPHANAQLLAAAGFAVLLPSMPMPQVLPEGGFDFAAPIAPALDAALATGCCDGTRIGLWGHSYGAYAVAMMNATSSRFRAVVASAGLYDLAGTIGTFGPSARAMPENGVPIASLYAWAERGQGRMGAPPWLAPARYVANSPVYVANRMHAPMLIIGADRDVSPLGEAEQLFSALYRQGKDAELVTYWGEGHVVASPANLRDLYARVIAFFRDNLGGEAEPPHAGR